ncbi:MAG: hypothetical protein AABY06_03925 [Nanoarchaeota archaeon]
MTRDNWAGAISGLALGIIGGIALVEILNNLFGKKCPRCDSQVEINQEYCNICGCKLK